MGLYNFQKRFVLPILAGEKTHTIRAPRVHMDEAGDTMDLYTGLRQKGARLLLRAPCVRVETIIVWEYQAIWTAPFGPLHGLSCSAWKYLRDNGPVKGFELLDESEAETLARRDGFRDFAEMMHFWQGTHALPFYGGIWHWDFNRRTKK